MIKMTAQPKTLDQHFEAVRLRGRALFSSRTVRDRLARMMRDKGIVCFANNHQDVNLHARHVADFEGEWTNQTEEYKRTWDALYSIQIV